MAGQLRLTAPLGSAEDAQRTLTLRNAGSQAVTVYGHDQLIGLYGEDADVGFKGSDGGAGA